MEAIGSETRAKIRDRRASLDDAETEQERKAIKRIYTKLPEKPEDMFGYISSLAPKEDKIGHGKGMLYMSFYNQAKKKFKIKSVASENDKAWCTQCKMKGHYKNSWKCPNSDKEIPTERKKEFMNFCATSYE